MGNRRSDTLTQLRAGKKATVIVEDLKVSRVIVYRVAMLLKSGVWINDKPRSVQKASARTRIVVAGVRRRIKSSPTTPLRQIAREANLNKLSVFRAVTKIGWASLKRARVSSFSEKTSVSLLDRGKKFFDNLIGFSCELPQGPCSVTLYPLSHSCHDSSSPRRYLLNHSRIVILPHACFQELGNPVCRQSHLTFRGL